MKSRVLVTNRIPAAVLQRLESDLEIDYHTEKDALSRDQLLDRVRDKQHRRFEVLPNFEEILLHLLAGLCIESAKRLVHE